MNTVNKQENKDNAVNSDIAETTREEIKTLNVNMSRLRHEIPGIIHDEIQNLFKEFIKEIRKPRPYIETCYRG